MVHIDLLELQEFGIKVACEAGKFVVEIDDTAAPCTHTEPFSTLREAAFRVADLILDANRVYAMEDQAEETQRAYANLQKPAVRETAFSFLKETVYDACYSAFLNSANE